MGSEQPDPPHGTSDPGPGDRVEPVRTEFLDLDADGVPDAIEVTETFAYDTPDGAEVVEEIREVDAGIDEEGVPTTVTVTDTVIIDTDHDGAPDAAEVTTLTVHADQEPDAPDTEPSVD